MAISTYVAYFFEGYIALTVSLYMLSFALPRAAYGARSMAHYLTLAGAALVGVFVSIVLTLIGKQGISQWMTGRFFYYAMRLTTGVSFETEDAKNILGTTRPAIFIGNHQTELDVLMLGSIFPQYCSVTAKSSLKKVPILGWFMALSGSIFIDRKNSKDAREAMKGAANEIRAKRQSVYMFPEGTRSYTKDPVLLPFILPWRLRCPSCLLSWPTTAISYITKDMCLTRERFRSRFWILSLPRA
jgi:lysophosphatidate acyltransferase